jgi:hypothetical protein
VFQGLTPWGPIFVVGIVVLGGALLVLRITGRRGYAAAYGLFVLSLASAGLGLIATIAFVWAVGFFVLAVGALIGTVKRRPPQN